LATSTTQNIPAAWIFERIIRILHVDDDVAFLQNAKNSLETNTGFQVESVISVAEARSKLKFGKFDVILSDYQMPQKTGLEFLTELRSCGILTPFILVAEKERAEVITRALNLGVCRYIEKQSDTKKFSAQLVEAIHQVYAQFPIKAGIRENIDFLRELYDNLQTGIIIIQPATHTIVAANKAALNLIGATKEQLIGKTCQTICTTPKGNCPITNLNQTISEEEQVLNRMNSRQTPILKTVQKVVLSGEEYLIESIVDISKTKKQEQKLKEKCQEFMVLFSVNPQAIVFCDKNFSVKEVNPSFISLFGCSFNDIKGQDAIKLFTSKNLAAENNWMKQQLLDGHLECQTKRIRFDGSEVNIFLYGAAVPLDDGSIAGFVLFFQDTTEVTVAREELSRLIDEQNLSLGKTRLKNEQLSVTGGITRHDIRNKLMALTFKAYIAKKRSADNPEVVNCLKDIEAISNNIARLLDFAKTYEMLGTEENTRINVGKIVVDAVSLFVDLKGVTVNNECQDFEVKADSMLVELFHNMIDNSLKYGVPKITQIRVHAQINNKGVTELIYEDNGNGIDPEIKARLFQKGVTTKGTGYGLWLIRRICEMYGWSVQETGVYGQGVRFVMKIP
jgi:PAS domain S-box-containing protein